MNLVDANSVLRRLPGELDRRQALFLDGIRHAADIAGLAYSRLSSTLTEIAVDQDCSNADLITSAFLDAWAVVDAIDRLRSLLYLLPGREVAVRVEHSPSFRERTTSVRHLRNVADHLAERADYVVARHGTALGILSWVTVDPLRENALLSCMIVPGTAAVGVRGTAVNPIGRPIMPPTDLITLAAGEFSAELSASVRYTAQIVRDLEGAVLDALDRHGLRGAEAGTDLVLKVQMVWQSEAQPGDG